MSSTHTWRLGLSLAVVVSVLVAGAATAAPHSASSQQQTCPIPVLGDPDSVTLSGPTVLWPPDHRLVTYTLTAAETPQEQGTPLPHGVTVSYTVTVQDRGVRTGKSQDAQPPSGSASGDFSVPVHFRLRAERSGTGIGWTYRIDWSATFDGGLHQCSSGDGNHHPFVVTVPHDRSH